MSEPAIALIIAILIIILLVILFKPNSKFLNFWRQRKHNKQNALMEHALKYLYECEKNHTDCSLPGLAEALSTNQEQAQTIVKILISSELLIDNKEKFELTSEGRDYALRIIRIHRLWERYLAEETGLPESSWHKEADIQEHNLTLEQAEKLNRKLGNPLYDPHGDPIPTSDGKVPLEPGADLTELEKGKSAVITHIEDEPPEVYESLIKKGFHLGMQVKIEERQNGSFRLIVDGQEKTIKKEEALNINITPISEEQQIEYTSETLDSLKIGQQAEIIAISKACHGQQRRRLMDLGVLPGTEITVEMESLGGDPIAYFIRGTTIALRRNQAKMIHIKPLQKEDIAKVEMSGSKDSN